MTRLETAEGVAARLFAAEDAIDGAIREAARLTLAVADARGDLKLAAVVGTEVFDRAAALSGKLAASRAEAVALHEALAGVRDQLRIRMPTHLSGLDKPPPPPSFAELEDAPPMVAPVRRLHSL